MSDVIATVSFEIVRGEERRRVSLELVPSGASPYGNRNAMIFKEGNKIVDRYDVRYDTRCNTAYSFRKYSRDILSDIISSDFVIVENNNEEK